ncbi:MAG: sugar O-acetyltransferase, partial [Sulfitobacter sp.]
PIHMAYGFNITLGDKVYVNAGCTILDSAKVTLGNRTMLGPNVGIYCAEHHKEAALRAQGLERAHPISIGNDVWIGGAALILPGVTIADGAIVGAGAVVTHNVAAGQIVVGNPARPKPD